MTTMSQPWFATNLLPSTLPRRQYADLSFALMRSTEGSFVGLKGSLLGDAEYPCARTYSGGPYGLSNGIEGDMDRKLELSLGQSLI